LVDRERVWVRRQERVYVNAVRIRVLLQDLKLRDAPAFVLGNGFPPPEAEKLSRAILRKLRIFARELKESANLLS
jgi:hypothetical protein